MNINILKIDRQRLISIIASACMSIAAVAANPAHAGDRAGLRDIMRAAKNLDVLNSSDNEIIVEARRQAMEADRLAARPDSERSRRLARLTEGLDVVNGFRLNYKVLLSQQPNAFALPSGDVRVNSGLMDMMTDDELVFVIGHEVGHVFLQHGKKKFKRGAMMNMLRFGAELAGVDREAIKMGTAAATAGSSAASRKTELAADRVGLSLLQTTRRDLNAAVSATQKLAPLSRHTGFDKLFASHPDALARAKKLWEMIPEDQRAPAFEDQGQEEPQGITLTPFGS